VKIVNKLETSVKKKDPTIGKLNAVSAKQVRSIKPWMEKYSKERTGTRRKARVTTQISPRKEEMNIRKYNRDANRL
jgi:hypothetical protein